MLDKDKLREDLGIAKALIWLGKNDIKWCRVNVLHGPNEHGQYQVRRIRDGFEGTTTEVMNLTDADREKIREGNY